MRNFACWKIGLSDRLEVAFLDDHEQIFERTEAYKDEEDPGFSNGVGGSIFFYDNWLG